MKHLRLTVLISVFFCMTALTAYAINDKKDRESTEEENAPEINWLRYDEGLKKARDENKHVFIDFTTSWCRWCKVMDKETFSRPDVIELLNDHFVSVQVDGDSKRQLDIDGFKITEQNLTRREFRVTAFPTFWFLKADGSKLASFKGYRPTEYMIEAFNFVKDYKYDSTRTETGEEKDK